MEERRRKNKQKNKVEYNAYMRRNRDFQSHCSGTGGGPSLAQCEPYNPDVHGSAPQDYSIPAMVPTPFNTMKFREGIVPLLLH